MSIYMRRLSTFMSMFTMTLTMIMCTTTQCYQERGTAILTDTRRLVIHTRIFRICITDILIEHREAGR